MELRKDYSKSYKRYFMMMILASLSAYVLAFGFLTLGVDSDIVVPAIIMIYIGFILIGMYQFAIHFPGVKKGFWAKTTVALLGTFRVGWDQPELKTLPWKTILGWGISATMVHPEIISLIADQNWDSVLMAIPIAISSFIVTFFIVFYIGYLAAHFFKKSV